MRQFIFVCLLAVLLQPVVPTRGQTPEDDHFRTEESKDKGPKRKTPSLFHRTAQDTPAAQLVYADSLRKAERIRKAMRQYNNLVHAWGSSPEALKAQRSLADLRFERKEYQEAFDEYQYLIDFYPGQFAFDEVIEKQFQLANAIKTRRVARFLIFPGVTDPERAIPMFEKIVANAPSWERSQEALFYVALINEETENWADAVAVYDRILQRYPDSRFAASAAFARARCLYTTATERGRDEFQLNAAMAAFASFIHDHPSDANVKEAQARLDELRDKLTRMYFDRAVFYDKSLKNPTAAIVAYRDLIRTFPMSTSEERKQAEARVLELEAAEKGNEKK
jgi:outer membrane protein assembly factor BamD (BamD/ComL family)